MGFSDQSAPPASPVVPTPEQLAEMRAIDAAAKANMKRKPPKAVKAEKSQESVTVIPGKKRGGLIRGDGCAVKGKTRGRHC